MRITVTTKSKETTREEHRKVLRYREITGVESGTARSLQHSAAILLLSPVLQLIAETCHCLTTYDRHLQPRTWLEMPIFECCVSHCRRVLQQGVLWCQIFASVSASQHPRCDEAHLKAWLSLSVMTMRISCNVLLLPARDSR